MPAYFQNHERECSGVFFFFSAFLLQNYHTVYNSNNTKNNSQNYSLIIENNTNLTIEIENSNINYIQISTVNSQGN